MSSHSNRTSRLPRSLDRWFSSKPVLISMAFAVVTVVLGSYLRSPFESVLLAALELIFGVAIWAARSVSRQLEDFQAGVERYHQLLRNVWVLGDFSVLDRLTGISRDLRKLRDDPVLLNYMRSELTTSADRFAQMAAAGSIWHWARRPPQDILLLFEAYLDSMYEGCRYDALSGFRFWSRDTLCRPQDFLDINVAAARDRGVEIRRVFLVDQELTSTDIAELKRHHEASKNLGPLMTVKVYDYRDQGESYDDYGTFAVCTDPDQRAFLLTMHYEETHAPTTSATAGDGQLKSTPKRHFQAIEVDKRFHQVRVCQERFERVFERGLDLEQYLEGLPASSEVATPVHRTGTDSR